MSDAAARLGTLVLVPNALDLGNTAVDLDEVLPRAVLQRAAALTHWVAEDARSTRAFLKRVATHVALAAPLQAIEIRELPRPRKGSQQPAATPAQWAELLAPARAGHDLGLISEAGLPAVADPGAALVDAAHRLGVPVLPLPGPSSLMLALAASGLNGQCFAFAGYLPQQPAERRARLKELEAVSRRLGQTQLLIETPYRNAALLSALLDGLAKDVLLSVSCGLTLPEGRSRTDTVAGWIGRPWTLPDRVPAVFAFLAR